MPYLDYNLPLQRTGFRPYGTTSTWTATQLSGFGLGYRRQIFSEPGGRRLGQWQSGFSPAVLSGLGQSAAVCLDQNQNSVPCADPNCTYGDCGSSAAQVTIGALCLDQNQNQIVCTDPNCTYGDCLSPPKAKGTIATPVLSPGPSPRVSAPLTMFPSTSYVATAPPTATTQSLWTQLTSPASSGNLLLLAGAAIAAMVLLGGKK